ncbi:hypothetical protein NIES4102_15420 [Chondrocystis sp. NIES-4102]|nr:hypothetical protein NIES4102_15420 [Chondrocystis sp. NIES-4102]
MNNSFAIITPSYAPDFTRCQLLCETLDEYSVCAVKHYVIVDQKDFKLFASLQRQHRQIITVESILPWWIKKASFLNNGWLSFKSLPIRNWIIQQIVKLSIAQYITEDVLIFVDSDVAFVRSFNVQDFIKNNQVRLYSQPNQITPATQPLSKWHEVSHKLLGLPDIVYPTSNYLGNFITWRRENVLALHEYLEKVHSKNWIEVIANSWQLSEYILYGTFVESILKQQSQHYYDSQMVCHDYWQTIPMSQIEIENFFNSCPDKYFAIMISAKSQTPVSNYLSYIIPQDNINSDWCFA